MSAIPVSKTKILPPRRRAELLTRRRLLDRLFESLDKRLLLLSAPAGYGKTSLLIDLVHNSELPCSWLALDSLDSDPQRFLTYFIAALRERFPNFGAQSASILSELKSFDEDLERLVITLVNEMYEHIEEHFILVLDDFHFVEAVHPVQRFINRFIQLVDENCHLILSSRTLVALPELPLMAAREQVSGLGFSDLAFRVDEIQALLRQNKKVDLSDREARMLLEETEGWVTGLQFSDTRILRGGEIATDVNLGVHLFDYLGQQVLDQQSEETQRFLLRTSLLEEFDAALCENVLAPLYESKQDWPALMRAIMQNNLFALPVGAEGRSIRYHHLFQDFLRDRYQRDFPSEIAPVRTRLALAYEQRGEWEQAHHVLELLGDQEELAALVERASVHLIQRANLTLESWVNALPPSLQTSRPGLISLRGALTNVRGDTSTALELLGHAIQRYREIGDSAGLALALARRGAVHRNQGDYSAMIADADESLRLVHGMDELQFIEAEALRIKGVALLRLGEVRKAIPLFEYSLATDRRIGDAFHTPVMLTAIGLAHAHLGELDAAIECYRSALALVREHGNMTLQSSLLNNLGVVYQTLGEYELAAAALEDSLLCAQRSSLARDELLTSISLGDVYLEVEAFDLAVQNYDRAEHIMPQVADTFLTHALAFSRAALALAQEDTAAARIQLESVERSVEGMKSKFEIDMLWLLYGRIALFEGDAERAVSNLRQAAESFEQQDYKSESFAARVWLAAAAQAKGEGAAAIDSLQAILAASAAIPNSVLIALHQARRWLLPLHKQPSPGRGLTDLLTQAARLEERLPETRRQLRRQIHAMQAPAPHLSIEALGRAQVFKAGRPISLSDWQTQSVRDLFFYFLKLKKPVTKEQIAEVLWPDQFVPAKLRLRFKNVLYRLRRAVVQDVIYFEDVFYSFNRNIDFEYDVEAFEAHLARAKSASTIEEKIQLYQKAVDLVRGPYLEDIYADWVIPERQRLSQLYLNALASLGELYLAHGQANESLMICERAIGYDPVFEPAYRISMEAYNRLGDQASVTRIYQACRESYQRQFDLPPSKEIQELYRRLVH